MPNVTARPMVRSPKTIATINNASKTIVSILLFMIKSGTPLLAKNMYNSIIRQYVAGVYTKIRKDVRLSTSFNPVQYLSLKRIVQAEHRYNYRKDNTADNDP